VQFYLIGIDESDYLFENFPEIRVFAVQGYLTSMSSSA
jgi:hypothetical protein